MSDRAFKSLLAAFLALAGLWLALVASERAKAGVPRLWARAKEARKLSLGRPGRETVLVRSPDGAWFQQAPFRFAGDGPAVEKLLKQLSDARLSEPLAGASRQAEFQVADADAFAAKGWLDPAAPPAFDAIVGKQGSDFDSVFVRRRGSPDVLEARGLALFDISRPPGSWADKLVCALPADSVTSVELSQKASTLRFLKEGASWTLGGKPLKDAERAARLDPLLRSLARLEADAVEEGPPPKAEARLRARCAGAQAQTVELEFGPAGHQGQRKASRAGAPGVRYLIEGWKLDFLKALEGPAKAPARSPSRRGR